MLKILHCNANELFGGAARAANRIHKGLRNNEVCSDFFVQNKESNDLSVYNITDKYDRIFMICIIYIELLIKKVFLNSFIPWSINYFNNNKLITFINKSDYDIVNLHWINQGFISINDIKKIDKPIVWTLHDSWAFTGGCHIPFSCNKYQTKCSKCEQLKLNCIIDLSKFIWRKKDKCYKEVDITFVTPSNWLSECVGKSALLRNKQVKVIPNGIDIQKYKPIEKKFARSVLNIESGKRIILFGAVDSTSDENKGFKYLQQAIKKLHFYINNSDDVEIIVFGSNEPENIPDFGYPIKYLGRLHDDISLNVLYSCVDVMVVPSKSENFPNTVLESLSCGTPVVAFAIGGIPDQIDHKKNGYLAIPYEAEDLSRGIAYILEDEDRWKVLSQNARKKVINNFDINIVAKQYIKLYGEVLKLYNNL